MSQNKITFGLEKVHIAFMNENENGWETPIHVEGAINWTPSPEGEQFKVAADNNSNYYVVNINNGYTSELGMLNVPKEIKARMLGWYVDGNGMLVEVTNATPRKFALMGQILGDKQNGRFVYYDCVANRPSKENATKSDSITTSNDVLPVIVSPVEVIIDGEYQSIVKGEVEKTVANTVAYNNFFNAVTLPTSATVNKTKLANAITVANSLTQAEYVTSTWTIMQTVLTNATTVNSSATAPQNQVDAAYTNLMNAIASLEVEA